MKALVTGGAGFLGSHLVDRLLVEGHSVDVVDDLSSGTLTNLAGARSDPSFDFRFHRLDIRRPALADLMARRAPEIVVHLAAPHDPDGPRAAQQDQAGADVGGYADATILGALNVLAASVRAGVTKVVVALSAAVYGEPDRRDQPLREGMPLQPATHQGVAQRAVLDYLGLYRARHQLEFTAAVLGEVYGPRQDPDAQPGTVAALAGRLLQGLACTLPGPAKATRDYLYVDDAVDALARATVRGGGLLINVATGRATSMEDLYMALTAHTGVPEWPARFAPLPPGHPEQVSLDPGRAAIQLGWRPWTSLAEGVVETVAALDRAGYRNRSSS